METSHNIHEWLKQSSLHQTKPMIQLEESQKRSKSVGYFNPTFIRSNVTTPITTRFIHVESRTMDHLKLPDHLTVCHPYDEEYEDNEVKDLASSVTSWAATRERFHKSNYDIYSNIATPPPHDDPEPQVNSGVNCSVFFHGHVRRRIYFFVTTILLAHQRYRCHILPCCHGNNFTVVAQFFVILQPCY